MASQQVVSNGMAVRGGQQPSVSHQQQQQKSGRAASGAQQKVGAGNAALLDLAGMMSMAQTAQTMGSSRQGYGGGGGDVGQSRLSGGGFQAPPQPQQHHNNAHLRTSSSGGSSGGGGFVKPQIQISTTSANSSFRSGGGFPASASSGFANHHQVASGFHPKSASGTTTPAYSPRFNTHAFASPGNGTGSEPNSRAHTPSLNGAEFASTMSPTTTSTTTGSIPVGVRSNSTRNYQQTHAGSQPHSLGGGHGSQPHHVSFEPSSVGSTGSSFHPSRSARKGSMQQHHPYTRSGSTTPLEPPPSPWGGMNGTYPFPGLTPVHEGQQIGQGQQQRQQQHINVPSSSSSYGANPQAIASGSFSNGGTPFGSFGANRMSRDDEEEERERDRQAEENTYWNAVNTFAQNEERGIQLGNGSFADSVPTSGAATPITGQPLNMADLMSPEFVALLNSAEGAGLSDEAVAAAINGLVQTGSFGAASSSSSFGTNSMSVGQPLARPVAPVQSAPTSQSLLTRRLQQQQQMDQSAFNQQSSGRVDIANPRSGQAVPSNTSGATPNQFSSSLPGSAGANRFGTSARSTGQNNAFGSPQVPSSGFSSSFGYTPGSLSTNRSGGWGPSRGVATPSSPMTNPSSLSTSLSGQLQTPHQGSSVPGSSQSFGTSAKSSSSKVRKTGCATQDAMRAAIFSLTFPLFTDRCHRVAPKQVEKIVSRSSQLYVLRPAVNQHVASATDVERIPKAPAYQSFDFFRIFLLYISGEPSGFT